MQRAAGPGRTHDDAPSFEQDDLVVVAQTHTAPEPVDEGAVERNGGDHGAPGTARTDHGDLPCRRPRFPPAYSEAAGGLDRQVRLSPEQARQRATIPGNEGTLERRLARNSRRGGVGRRELVLIGG